MTHQSEERHAKVVLPAAASSSLVSPSNFHQARALLLSLLRGTAIPWHLSFANEPPFHTSLLLCGVSGSGKTHLCEEAVQSCACPSALSSSSCMVTEIRPPSAAQNAIEHDKKGKEQDYVASSVGDTDGVSSAASCSPSPQSSPPPPLHSQQHEHHSDRRRRVITVSPSLALASVYRDKKNNCTTLRRIIIEEIINSCLDSASDSWKCYPPTAHTGVSAEKEKTSVLILLDHLELFMYGSDDGGRVAEDNEIGSSGYHTLTSSDHPSLLTDLYTVLRSSPPLLSSEEKDQLGIDRMVIVGCFSGEPADAHPVLVKSFDLMVALPTPTQWERESFFADVIPDLLFSTIWNQVRSADAAASRWGHSRLRGSEEDVKNEDGHNSDENEVDDEAEIIHSLASSTAAQSLSTAIALRSGGMTYQGLSEVRGILSRELEGWWSTRAGGVHHKKRAAVRLVTQLLNETECGILAQRVVQTFQRCASVSAALFRTSAGYVDVQVTRWSDIAGLHAAKNELQQMVMRPLMFQQVYHFFGVRPSTGILLYGPPGTGKTMLAKAMATELNASFVYMDLPGLIKAEVGESEKKLNAFFAAARERSPSVIFIDELQAAFGIRYQEHGDNRGNHRGTGARRNVGSSHESRLVSHLLQCIDAAREDWKTLIIVVGATNVVEHLDPLLLRAGRLDTHVSVPLPDKEARAELVRRIVCGDWAHWFSLPWQVSPSPSNLNELGGTSGKERKESYQHKEEDGELCISDELQESWIKVLEKKVLWLPQEDEKKDIRKLNQSALVARIIQQALSSTQEALMRAFVEQSENLSGAEIRNATTSFAIEFLKTISTHLNSNGSISTTSALTSFPAEVLSPDTFQVLSLLVFDSMVEGPMAVQEDNANDTPVDTAHPMDTVILNHNSTPLQYSLAASVGNIQLKQEVLQCVNTAIQMLRETKARGTSFYK